MAVLIRAHSFEITALSSAAVLHALTDRMRSLNLMLIFFSSLKLYLNDPKGRNFIHSTQIVLHRDLSKRENTEGREKTTWCKTSLSLSLSLSLPLSLTGQTML